MNEPMELHELFAALDDARQTDPQGADAGKIQKRTLEQLALLDGAERPAHRLPRKFFLTGLAAALAVALAACACAVSAQVWGVRLFDRQEKQQLQKPLYAVSTSTSQPDEEPGERLLAGFSGEILDVDWLEENDVLFFDEVGTVCGVANGECMEFPAFVFDNGEIAILTKEDGSGWILEENGQLTLSLRQNTEDNPQASPGGDRLALGVIVDGIPCELTCGKDAKLEYTYTAHEAEEVYFYVQNFSAGPIVIEDAAVGTS